MSMTMSRPRPVLPSTTYLVTRRCAQRQFLLRPCEEINRFFLYCLAFAASRTGVLIHAACVLSNHFHLVLTDVSGNLPEFMLWLDGTLARGLNAYYGRWENFWVPGTYSRVELLDPPAVLEKMVYTLTNPVAAGLVCEGSQWPGVRSDTLREGNQRIRVQRPKFFFSDDGELPETIELLIQPPQSMAELEGSLGTQSLHEAVLEKEAEIRSTFEAEGRRFLGRDEVLRQSPKDSPSSQEPRRNLNPQVACRDKERRTRRLNWIRVFFLAYREAFRKLAEGVRDVVFPAGTYWLRIHLRCLCADPAPG